MRRGQRPADGHLNKCPAHNYKGIGGSDLLHLLAHIFQSAPVKDYYPMLMGYYSIRRF